MKCCVLFTQLRNIKCTHRPCEVEREDDGIAKPLHVEVRHIQ